MFDFRFKTPNFSLNQDQGSVFSVQELESSPEHSKSLRRSVYLSAVGSRCLQFILKNHEFRRTVKATILLVPLLGVSNIPLFYEPDRPSAIYMLGSAILQHSQVCCFFPTLELIQLFQGIFIAVLYCFSNAEVQNAVKRQLTKMPIPRLRYNYRPY